LPSRVVQLECRQKGTHPICLRVHPRGSSSLWLQTRDRPIPQPLTLAPSNAQGNSAPPLSSPTNYVSQNASVGSVYSNVPLLFPSRFHGVPIPAHLRVRTRGRPPGSKNKKHSTTSGFLGPKRSADAGGTAAQEGGKKPRLLGMGSDNSSYVPLTTYCGKTFVLVCRRRRVAAKVLPLSCLLREACSLGCGLSLTPMPQPVNALSAHRDLLAGGHSPPNCLPQASITPSADHWVSPPSTLDTERLWRKAMAGWKSTSPVVAKRYVVVFLTTPQCIHIVGKNETPHSPPPHMHICTHTLTLTHIKYQ